MQKGRGIIPALLLCRGRNERGLGVFAVAILKHHLEAAQAALPVGIVEATGAKAMLPFEVWTEWDRVLKTILFVRHNCEFISPVSMFLIDADKPDALVKWRQAFARDTYGQWGNFEGPGYPRWLEAVWNALPSPSEGFRDDAKAIAAVVDRWRL